MLWFCFRIGLKDILSFIQILITQFCVWFENGILCLLLFHLFYCLSWILDVVDTNSICFDLVIIFELVDFCWRHILEWDLRISLHNFYLWMICYLVCDSNTIINFFITYISYLYIIFAFYVLIKRNNYVWDFLLTWWDATFINNLWIEIHLIGYVCIRYLNWIKHLFYLIGNRYVSL